MKRLLKFTPEIYFMGFGIYWAAENYVSRGIVNYFALLLVWLLFLQLFYKNRILGLIYGGALGVASAYLLFDAELAEFDKFGMEVQSQAIGMGIFAAGLFMAGLMVYRFATVKYNYDEESVLTVTY